MKVDKNIDKLGESLLQFPTTRASTLENAFVNRHSLDKFIEEFARSDYKTLKLTVELPAGFDGSEVYQQIDLQLISLNVDPSRQLLLMKVNKQQEKMGLNLLQKGTQTIESLNSNKHWSEHKYPPQSKKSINEIA